MPFKEECKSKGSNLKLLFRVKYYLSLNNRELGIF